MPVGDAVGVAVGDAVGHISHATGHSSETTLPPYVSSHHLA